MILLGGTLIYNDLLKLPKRKAATKVEEVVLVYENHHVLSLLGDKGGSANTAEESTRMEESSLFIERINR